MMLAISVLFILVLSVVEGNNSTCEHDEFPCFDGSCIDKDKWCDNDIDCIDGTDENYCSLSSFFRPDPNNCSDNFFRCKYGPCIPLKGRCDGHYACLDRSDEEECGVAFTEFVSDSTTVPTSTYSSSRIPETNTSTTLSATTYSTKSGLGSVSSTSRPDTVLPNTTDNKHVHLERDFVELNASQFKDAKIKAQHWLLKIRNQNGGWNEETARAFTALHLSAEGLHLSASEKSLLTKELHLKVLAALLRNESTPVSLEKLSLYMNALTASCESTKNFYGRDLVHALRQQVDLLHGSLNSSNPLIYLTLCLNDATTRTDLMKIKEIVHSKWNEDKVGVLAIASLAATCISRISKFSTHPIGHQVASHLYSTVIKQGLPDNVYDLALVTQALNEAHVNQDLWNRSEALKRIINEQDSDGSFGNIQSTYFAIPVLSGRSLLAVKHCSANIPDGLTALEDVQDENGRKIKYTLFFGHPVTSSISLFVPVKTTSSFFDVMRKAAAMNPSYEFRYSLTGGKPVVYSIGGVANDPEYGMYWNLYIITDRHHLSLKPSLSKYEDDIRLFIPATGDEVVYWWKSMY